MWKLDFPERVYTREEVMQARSLIKKGYKHDLKVDGTPDFVGKVEKALSLIEIAGYCDFLRTYIRTIRELTDGLSQLRQEEVAIWFNVKALGDIIDDAGFIIQKTQQMKDFIEGKPYYETAEVKAVNKRLEFVEALKDKSNDRDIKKRCKENLKKWNEQPFP